MACYTPPLKKGAVEMPLPLLSPIPPLNSRMDNGIPSFLCFLKR